MQPELAINKPDPPSHRLFLERPAESSTVKAAKSLFEGNGTPCRLASHSRRIEQASAVKAVPVESNVLLLPSSLPPHHEPAYELTLHEQCALGAGATSRLNNFKAIDDVHRPPITSVLASSKTQASNEGTQKSDTDLMISQAVDMGPAKDAPRQAPGKTVRSRSENTYMSVTESEEDIAAGEDQLNRQKSERSGSHRHVRGDVKDDEALDLGRFGQSVFEVSPFDKFMPTDRSNYPELAWTRSASPKTSSIPGTAKYQPSNAINIHTHGSEKYATERVPNDDTWVLEPTPSHDDCARDDIQTANVGVQQGYDEV